MASEQLFWSTMSKLTFEIISKVGSSLQVNSSSFHCKTSNYNTLIQQLGFYFPCLCVEVSFYLYIYSAHIYINSSLLFSTVSHVSSLILAQLVSFSFLACFTSSSEYLFSFNLIVLFFTVASWFTADPVTPSQLCPYSISAFSLTSCSWAHKL